METGGEPAGADGVRGTGAGAASAATEAGGLEDGDPVRVRGGGIGAVLSLGRCAWMCCRR